MKIETKYNVGDYVWVLNDNRPVYTEILRPKLFVFGNFKKSKTDFSGELEWELNIRSQFFGNVSLTEKHLFDTKEECINSLKD